MKVLAKILLILILGVCVFIVMPQNVVQADAQSAITDINPDTSISVDNSLTGIIGKILGFLQIASGIAAVIMIAVTGFNYITGTPDVKKELPSKAVPILVGLVLVFGAVSIAKFIVSIATG